MATRDLYVFDLDGTLVDTLPDITRAVNAALVEHGAPARASWQIRGYLGEGARDLVRRALGGEPDEATLDVLVERYRAHYRTRLTVESRLYPGIEALLLGLDAPAMVLTNKPGPEARGILEALGVGGRFARIVGDGDGLPRKPDPTSLRALVEGARRPLYIGDSHIDAETARRAGVDFVWVSWGYGEAAAARRVDRAEQLLEI